ncbi:enoyl-CoA hydratase/isomerase family protein [Microbacterium sp. RD1]|uniref:enoyl-CoA hydratase/isomerase family protein n=1 Tax=Microbacterium sp. RD1 TaxID=3457313 RepID=UPI003FA5D018
MSALLVEREGRVATIVLNRPDRKNAFTIAMVDAWADALESCAADAGVGVIVVTGSGGNFCSGVDLAEFTASERTPLENKDLLAAHVHRVARALQNIDKPVLAAIEGVAVGAGLDMALMCDVRFAAPDVQLAEGYIRAGLVPGDGGAWLLPRIVGEAMALHLLWTGDVIGADEAVRLGIVQRVVADEPLGEFVARYAATLADKPPFVVRAIKRGVRQSPGQDLPAALDLMSSHMAVALSTPESQQMLARAAARRRPAPAGEEKQ